MLVNDVDANMGTFSRPNLHIEQSNRIDENLQHLHRQIQCSRILSSSPSRATPEIDLKLPSSKIVHKIIEHK